MKNIHNSSVFHLNDSSVKDIHVVSIQYKLLLTKYCLAPIQYQGIHNVTTSIAILYLNKINSSYQRCRTEPPFVIDFKDNGVAYKAVIYSYHAVNHHFKTNLNDR